jgi:hypothetical protein
LKLKKQRPASAKEWGTHFLVTETTTMKRDPLAHLSFPGHRLRNHCWLIRESI